VIKLTTFGTDNYEEIQVLWEEITWQYPDEDIEDLFDSDDSDDFDKVEENN
jgi:hypothetical protein